jgi:hypothetical protein
MICVRLDLATSVYAITPSDEVYLNGKNGRRRRCVYVLILSLFYFLTNPDCSADPYNQAESKQPRR